MDRRRAPILYVVVVLVSISVVAATAYGIGQRVSGEPAKGRVAETKDRHGPNIMQDGAPGGVRQEGGKGEAHRACQAAKEAKAGRRRTPRTPRADVRPTSQATRDPEDGPPTVPR